MIDKDWIYSFPETESLYRMTNRQALMYLAIADKLTYRGSWSEMSDTDFDLLQSDVADAINALMKGDEEGQMLINCYRFLDQYIVNGTTWTPMLINHAAPVLREDYSIYQDQQFFRVSAPGLYRVYSYHRFFTPSSGVQGRLLVRMWLNGANITNQVEDETQLQIGSAGYPSLRLYDDIYLDVDDQITFWMYCTLGGSVVNQLGANSWYKVYKVQSA
jgi:hypothetical protein